MSRRPIIFVTRELPSLAQRRLESLASVEIRQHNSNTAITRPQLLAGIKDADGLICLLSEKIDSELLRHASPNLKVISTVSVGYDHSHGLKLGYTPDVLTDATADTTVLLALMASRKAKQGLESVHSGTWGAFSLSRGLGTQFTDKTLGIVGFGRIGVATAHRLMPFGFKRVLYSASRPHEERARPLNAQFAELDELLAQADLVCVCCPLNAKTQGLFSMDKFRIMKQSAILVNTARGAIINQEDLLKALDQGLLAHAALDVTVPEPIPKDHPLVNHERCTILPHIGSATEETRNAMGNLAIDNALAGVFGEPLKAQVEL
ncbi:glyoxylate reductase [Linderina pennispora]|uniref:Glyoxylate reductase n=1 Tax=Linderina pennispora TaxID=61395 RepID=A0A1Y1W1D2_9FUNG|nr:glyoxylate reductase [Linderina pennispora]ORX67292.1 glyoxylate reductase [Linderina pennispora]